MRSSTACLLRTLMILGIALPASVPATDVDGPDDCWRTPIVDFGDAPEGVLAYPAVLGRFPTCVAVGAAGTQELAAGCTARSTAPGGTGYVRHQHMTGQGYWLGYPPAGIDPMGIDSEDDGKTNDTGDPASVCNTSIAVDCVESAFGMSFGQDECYASSDAAIDTFLTFEMCESTSVRFKTYNCKPDTTTVFLNILVDWNQDGDWNDNFLCPDGCAYEWAVKNEAIVLGPGNGDNTSPTFLAGPNVGYGWLRITLSDERAPDKFPWAGSADRPGGTLSGGETEDYPVEIVASASPCRCYKDYGDAPELTKAYPTCLYLGNGSTQDVDLGCTPASTLPGPSGYVRHVAWLTDPYGFWLGCGAPPGAPGVDGETDGKTSESGGGGSDCTAGLGVDCIEPAFGQSFGQDECYGDLDAGVSQPIFETCTMAVVNFETTNCLNDPEEAYLNILVDWNGDGDWNDVFMCPGGACAYEWGVQNAVITLDPGCQPQVSPSFLVGPRAVAAWMRVSLSKTAATPDFPWAGSALLPEGELSAGETEDYPVTILHGQTGLYETPRPGEPWMGPILPNPTRDGIFVRFVLAREEEVTLAVYDIAGRRLAELARGRLHAGEHRVAWSFRDAAGIEASSGYFLVRLRAGDRVLTRAGVRVR